MVGFSQVGGVASVEKNSNLAKIVLRVTAVVASVALLVFSLVGPVGMLHAYAPNAIAFVGTNTPTPTPMPTDTPTGTLTDTPTPSLISTPIVTAQATATANPLVTQHHNAGQTPTAGVTPVAPAQNGGTRSKGQTSWESLFPMLPIVIGGLISLCIMLAIGGVFLRRSQSPALRRQQGTHPWSRTQIIDEERNAVINNISPAESIQARASNYSLSSPFDEVLAGNYAQGTSIQRQTTANLKVVGRIHKPVQQITSFPKDMHMPALDDPRLVDYLKEYALGRLVVPPEQRETENA